MPDMWQSHQRKNAIKYILYVMIPEGTTLFPEYVDCSQMYYDDEPYAYWLSVPEYNFCNWILYKEYNDYISVCHPNDCLRAVSYEDIMKEFREYSFYEGMDRELLCKKFRQRSLEGDDKDFEDFITTTDEFKECYCKTCNQECPGIDKCSLYSLIVKNEEK